MRSVRIVFFSIILINHISIIASDDTKKADPQQVKIGNFALPVSQQPSPLTSFGQNIFNKDDVAAYAYVDYINGVDQSFTTVYPCLLYAFNDVFTIYFELPIAARYVASGHRSHGVGDLITQFEYAIYALSKETVTKTITTVFNFTVPTGSIEKNPITGLGAPSYFFGATANYVSPAWYIFTGIGVVVTTATKKGLQFGNEFLYQLGLSRNLAYKENEWIWNLTLEIDGTFTQESSLTGVARARNSGGNQILICPSFWFSTRRALLQAGVGGYVAQHLFGNQNKNKLYASFGLGWTF